MSYLIHPPGHQSDPVHTNEQAIVNALLTAWITGSNLPFNAECFDATVHRILTAFRLNNQAPPPVGNPATPPSGR